MLALAQPKHNGYFDLPVPNSPNRPNDSYYEEERSVEGMQQSKLPQKPLVIEFEDEPQEGKGAIGRVIKEYETVSQKASNISRVPSGRPPSGKSKKGSSKDGSLMDGLEARKTSGKRMTLNELAALKNRGASESSGGRSSQNSQRSRDRKEGCLMQYFHSDSEGGSQRHSSRDSRHSRRSKDYDPNPHETLLQTLKQRPLHTTAPEKQGVIRRNVYHIDKRGNLVKGDVFIPLNPQSGSPAP